MAIQAVLIDVARLGLWLMLLAVIFVPLERLFGLRPAAMWRRGMAADLGFYFLNSLLPGFVLSAPLAFVAWGAHRVVPGAVQDWVSALPFWARMAAGLVIGEIGFYWGHRWSHEIPLLWRFHAVHHRPDHMDWLVNTRAHPVDMVFTRLCGLVPLYALGLGGPGPQGDSLVPALIVIVGTMWGFFIHSNLRWRLGPFESVLSTPAFHHWHHTLTGPINRNYSSMLPWLDRVFGTHHLPKRWPDEYGVRPD
jgi:sterol desaturase/sphingolipid hydroxylase (fatty acid hydroxylase superfamily)